MVKAKVNKMDIELSVAGELETCIAETTYIVHKFYQKLYEQDPRIAGAFKKLFTGDANKVIFSMED